MHLYPIHLPNLSTSMNTPNIHDIIDLAYQVEQTRDPEIKAGLKRYLLYLINCSYDDKQPPVIPPVIPYKSNSCSICGLNGINGYVCTRFDCPVKVTSTL